MWLLRAIKRPQPVTGFLASIQRYRTGLTEALFGADVFREHRPDAPDRPRRLDFGQVDASEKLYAAGSPEEPTTPHQSAGANRPGEEPDRG